MPCFQGFGDFGILILTFQTLQDGSNLLIILHKNGVQNGVQIKMCGVRLT